MWLRRVGWFLLGLCLVAAVAGATHLVARVVSEQGRQQDQDPGGSAPAAFARAVAQRLAERYPELRASVEREGDNYLLVVRPAAPETRVAVDDLYRAVAESPGQRDQLIDDFLRRATAGLRPASAETLEQVRDHLLPMIKRRSFVIEHNEDKERTDRVPWKPLPNDLVICWVVDYTRQVRYVTVGDLHRWGRELGDVGTRALQNLTNRTEGQPMSVAKSEQGEVYFHDRGDGYDASRILVLRRQRAGPNPVWQEDLIVALPDRDLLVAAPVSAVEAIRVLMPRIKQDASSREHPLTEKLFLVRASGIEAYVLPPREEPTPR